MKNIVLSTRNIEEFVTDVADEVVKKLDQRNLISGKEHTDDNEQLLTIQDAAKLLHLSVPTLYSKVSRGELPVMKRSKRLYFLREELLAYLMEGRKKTKTEIESEASSYLIGRSKKGGKI